MRRNPNVTDTPAFRRWFGKSKVVDASGRPLVLYHGTTDNFTAFDFDRARSAYRVIFLTPDPSVASDFSMWMKAVGTGTMNVLPLYVRARRLLEYDAEKMGRRGESIRNIEDRLHDTGGPGIYRDAQRRGYDGVVFRNVRDDPGAPRISPVTDIYAFFDTASFKSATGNRGTFDPKDPDIRHNPRPEIPLKQAQLVLPFLEKYQGAAHLLYVPEGVLDAQGVLHAYIVVSTVAEAHHGEVEYNTVVFPAKPDGEPAGGRRMEPFFEPARSGDVRQVLRERLKIELVGTPVPARRTSWLGRAMGRSNPERVGAISWGRSYPAHVDLIPGGLADEKQPRDFNRKQLVRGRKVEREHTRNRTLAQEIAMDHLAEDPSYYRKLAKMERD
jgi:hypothetical protein